MTENMSEQTELSTTPSLDETAVTLEAIDQAANNVPILAEYYELEHQLDTLRHSFAVMEGHHPDETIKQLRDLIEQKEAALRAFKVTHADTLRLPADPDVVNTEE